jgi:hypothetical protein
MITISNIIGFIISLAVVLSIPYVVTYFGKKYAKKENANKG